MTEPIHTPLTVPHSKCHDALIDFEEELLVDAQTQQDAADVARGRYRVRSGVPAITGSCGDTRRVLEGSLMPTDRVRVENVTKIPTKRADVHEFTVYGIVMKDSRTVVYRTLNPWKASLCEKSRQTKRPIWVTWRMTGDWKDKNIAHLEMDETWLTT